MSRLGDTSFKAYDYLNQTHISKESGTNVSYQSNYSAIKSNILRFKNKRLTTVTAGGLSGAHHGTQTVMQQQDASYFNTSQDVSKGIKLPIPIQGLGT